MSSLTFKCYFEMPIADSGINVTGSELTGGRSDSPGYGIGPEVISL